MSANGIIEIIVESLEKIIKLIIFPNFFAGEQPSHGKPNGRAGERVKHTGGAAGK